MITPQLGIAANSGSELSRSAVIIKSSTITESSESLAITTDVFSGTRDNLASSKDSLNRLKSLRSGIYPFSLLIRSGTTSTPYSSASTFLSKLGISKSSTLSWSARRI